MPSMTWLLYHLNLNTTLLHENAKAPKPIAMTIDQTLSDQEPKPKPETYTTNQTTQLKIALRVVSFSRVELWRC